MDKYYLHCPYCWALIRDEDTEVCPNCNQDITQDAGVELTETEYAKTTRIECKLCGQLKPRLAITCPSCKEPKV